MTPPRLAFVGGLAVLIGLAGCNIDRLLHSPNGSGSGGPSAPHLVFASQPSQAVAGDPISLRVVVLDTAGNPMTYFNDSVTVSLKSNPGTATLSGTTTVPAVNGVATLTDLRIDKPGSGYTFQAVASGMQATSAPFDVTASAQPPPPPPPPATHLGFSQQPQPAVAGQTIAPVQVVALDDAGNIVSTFTGAVAIALGADASGGVLTGTTPVSAVNGRATFSDLRIDRAGSGYTLTATSTGLTAASSMAFDVTSSTPPPPPPPATRLVFTIQPGNALPLATMPPVEVTAVDDRGNPVPGFTGLVTLSIGHDASLLGGAHLSGTTTVAAVGGVARFTNLSIDQPGIGYTLRATAGGLTGVESAPFTILVP